MGGATAQPTSKLIDTLWLQNSVQRCPKLCALADATYIGGVRPNVIAVLASLIFPAHLHLFGTVKPQ